MEVGRRKKIYFLPLLTFNFGLVTFGCEKRSGKLRVIARPSKAGRESPTSFNELVLTPNSLPSIFKKSI
jgi:hypothetical protein